MSKKFKNFIITDDKGKPMAWDEKHQQLFYCTNFIDEPFPVRAYTTFQVKRYMRLSKNTRGKLNLSTTEYKLLPFDWNRFAHQNRYKR